MIMLTGIDDLRKTINCVIKVRLNKNVLGDSGLSGSKYGSFRATGAVIRKSAFGRIILRRRRSRPGKVIWSMT